MNSNLAQKQLDLLLKANWHIKDIREFFECGETSAFKTRREAITKYNGAVKFEDKKVSARAVLMVKGLNYENEIKIRKEILVNG